jgi:HPt (histidine-containing phosphotransfer) domain-containing protein
LDKTVDCSGKEKDFWNKIEQIDGISVKEALNLVSGKLDIYEKSLRLMIKEIEKCDKQLSDFISTVNMNSFSITAHSMKSSLANIGVKELSEEAHDLELASDRNDTVFCKANLPSFLEKLKILYSALKDAFSIKNQNRGPIEIPPELPIIFKKLEIAFENMNFSLIDEIIEKLDTMNFCDALNYEIEHIKDAALEMDYESAKELMQRLLE